MSSDRASETPTVQSSLLALPGTRAFNESLAHLTETRKGMARFIADMLDQDTGVILDAGSTAYLVAESLAKLTSSAAPIVLTNNLAAAIRLAGTATPCHLLGGRVDDLHFCCIVDPNVLHASLSALDIPMTYVMTGAAFSISDSSLWVRARRPDQFPFKQSSLLAATRVIAVVESSKLYEPFDGEHAFQLPDRELTLLTDDGIRRDNSVHDALAHACSAHGYRLVLTT